MGGPQRLLLAIGLQLGEWRHAATLPGARRTWRAGPSRGGAAWFLCAQGTPRARSEKTSPDLLS
eukprot:10218604-Lingulodinium_polyedra.AAC.1